MTNCKDHGIFRAIISQADSKYPADRLHRPYTTMRPPGNVPYLVDNLWEWKRPAEYPNRRYAAFASPSPELARKAVSDTADIYRVELKGESLRIAQLNATRQHFNVEDSKWHPECKILPKILINKLGRDWHDQPLSVRGEIAPLWMPCLQKEETEEIFRSKLLHNFRDEIYAAIQYWDDVALLNDINQPIDPAGEIFFEYPEGYTLLEI